MNSEPFLKPKLIGARFEGGAIPLELLADFAILEEMIVEVAKWKFREANPGRTRVPGGFTDGIALKLTGVEDGSAIPVISLFVAAGLLFPPSSQSYFNDARSAIIGAIGAAEKDSNSIVAYLPQKLLGYFDRFGRNLEDGEAIEFTEGTDRSPVRLTRETRRTLVLASSAEEVTEEIVVHGVIPEMDQQTNTFHVRFLDGTKVKAPLPRQHFETVIEAFNNYRTGQRVRIHASGLFNRANRLLSIESVEHVSLLDPLDIEARIDELKMLRQGWFEGKGRAPEREGLDWLSGAFGILFPEDRLLPHLYPTPEGGVRAEWSFGSQELSLVIHLKPRIGLWHALNLSDDTEQARTLNLNEDSEWVWLAAEVQKYAEGS